MYSDLDTLQHLVALHRMWGAFMLGAMLSCVAVTCIMGICFGVSTESSFDDDVRDGLRAFAKKLIPVSCVLAVAAVVCGGISAYYPSYEDMDAAVRLKQAEIMKDSPAAAYVIGGGAPVKK